MIETSEVNIDNPEERKKYLVSLSKIETYFDDNFWDRLGANNFSSRKRKFGRNNHRKSWDEHKKHSKKQKKFKRNKKINYSLILSYFYF